MKRTIALRASCGALLAFTGACSLLAQSQTPGPPQECAGAECTVNIVVTGGAGSCTVTDPGTLHVPRNGAPVIKWRVTGPYQFPQDGIVIQGNTGDFQVQPRPAGNQMFIVNDRNTKTAYYKYTIKVEGNGAACDKDPGIVNDGCDGC